MTKRQLAKALGLQKGGVYGVTPSAPAQRHYYFKHEVYDPETEELISTHLINFESRLDNLLKLFP
jgi:hypothetical protein